MKEETTNGSEGRRMEVENGEQRLGTVKEGGRVMGERRKSKGENACWENKEEA